MAGVEVGVEGVLVAGCFRAGGAFVERAAFQVDIGHVSHDVTVLNDLSLIHI